jgi:thiol-disulfide isomerase/thioredoxin
MVTEITMDEMIAGLPVPDNDLRVVMFFGTTCGPCQATRPHYESTAKLFAEKTTRIKLFRINAWEPAEQAKYCLETLGVKGVPHFKVFCRGEQILEKVGGGDEPTMMKFIHDGIDEAFKRFGERI